MAMHDDDHENDDDEEGGLASLAVVVVLISVDFVGNERDERLKNTNIKCHPNSHHVFRATDRKQERERDKKLLFLRERRRKPP
jgi:hypothetical protein